MNSPQIRISKFYSNSEIDRFFSFCTDFATIRIKKISYKKIFCILHEAEWYILHFDEFFETFCCRIGTKGKFLPILEFDQNLGFLLYSFCLLLHEEFTISFIFC